MTTVKSSTWPLAEADAVAQELISLLQSSCETIQVAGSVRRRKSQVGDLELLAISKTHPAGLQLSFDRPRLAVSALDTRVRELIVEGVLDYRLNKRGSKTYGPMNKRLVHTRTGISLDLFSTEAQNWGMALMVRTGPKDFNIAMMTRFRTLNMLGHAYGGVTDQQGNELACPTEEEVFRLLGWPYRPPEERAELRSRTSAEV